MPRLYSELRGLMTAYDYTQPQLAREIGVCRASIANKINGHAPFTLDEAYTILKLFGIPSSRLHEVFPPDGMREINSIEIRQR